MSYKVAGIDVHKRLLVAVVADAAEEELSFEGRRFGSTTSEVRHLAAWLRERGVQEVVMESTAQYWKPVWLDLEPHFHLHLAQAQSNRAPRGRKNDFGDSQRLVRRFLAAELDLSFVPAAEQRAWRTLTRGKHQLTRERVRVIAQLEALLEEARIKLSSVITDLWGASGQRILRALADGEDDPVKLAALGDARLQCGPEQLCDALTGQPGTVHRHMLACHLERLDLLDRQIAQIHRLLAERLHDHQEAVERLAQVPGIRVDAAHQIIAEVGVTASAFDSAAQLASWAGVCPGQEESAGVSRSNRSAKGNAHLRRILNQAAQAAVRTNGSRFQVVFRRLVPRLGFAKALWAIAHRLCRVAWKILHDGVSYQERGALLSPQGQKRRIQRLMKELRQLGYTITPNNPAPATP
jgi:transposase